MTDRAVVPVASRTASRARAKGPDKRGLKGAAIETSQRNVEAEERQRRAWELRLGGASLRQIAETLGIEGTNPEARARELVIAYRTKTRAMDAERAAEERELQASRLDRLLLDLWTARLRRVPTGEVDVTGKAVERTELDLGTFDRIVKVMERQAKLLGLDASDVRDDARLELLAEQAEAIARALDAALMELGLSEELRERGRTFVANQLRLIEGEAVRLGEKAG